MTLPDDAPCKDPLTLSRQDLYELAWSKPMARLAADFGISDVALAKRCRKLLVPVPGRGYWARVAAGQTPRQKPLPKPEDKTVLAFPAPAALPRVVAAAEQSPAVSDLASRVVALSLPRGTDPGSASPPVQRLARDLKLSKSSEIRWRNGPDRSGPVPDIRVSGELLGRALDVANLLIVGAEQLGWDFVAGKENASALQVAGEQISFRIEERRRQVRPELSEEDRKRQRRGEPVYSRAWDLEWGGDLRLHLFTGSLRYPDKTWNDGKRRRLEDQICGMLLHCQTLAQKVAARKEEERLAEQRRRQEDELEEQRRERAEHEHELIVELERQAGAWLQARLLRAYVRAAQRALGDEVLRGTVDNQEVNFLEWAGRYVDQLDPLHPAPRNTDLTPDPYAWNTERKLIEQMRRLTGHEGQQSWKLVGPADEKATP